MGSNMLALALIGHLVGDFLLQNDWMAENKKKSSVVCAVHALVWTLCVCFFTGWGIIQAVPLFLMHFAQDRSYFVDWWMDLIGQHKFRTGLLAPWSSIIVDNVFHVLQIWAVWLLLRQFV